MGLQFNTNLPALNILRQTQQSSTALRLGFQRLASGQRINRAADDAAGLAISERLRTDIRQYSQESNNLQSGINAVQTADGALETQGDAVQRIRELALQASNGTLTDDQRTALNAEAQQLVDQINDTAADTEFNGTRLLDGSQTTIDLGAGDGAAINLNSSTAGALGVSGIDLSTQAGAQAAVGNADTALQRIDQNRASLGAQQNRFERAIEVRGIQVLNAQESESRIRDLDVARQSIEQARNEILQRTGIAALLQSNLNGQAASRLLGG